MIFFFFFQAEDGIRDIGVTGVQTCALPISARVHAEYAAFLNQYTEDVIAEAREFLGDAVRAAYTSTSASKASEGLIATATQAAPALIALGPARDRPFGRLAIGRTSDVVLRVS